MSKVTIVTKRENRFGNQMILPIAGEVQISTAGEVEVSEEAAAHLVANGLDWNYKPNAKQEKKAADEAITGKVTRVESSGGLEPEPGSEAQPEGGDPSKTPIKTKKKKTKKSEPKVAKVKGQEEVKEEVKDEKAESKPLDLSELTVPKLKDVCEDLKLPAKEWDKLKKADLIKYIESKIK